MQYTDDTEMSESTSSFAIGLLTIIGIVLLFTTIFNEASNVYGRAPSGDKMVVVKAGHNP